MNISEFAHYWLGSRSVKGIPISLNDAMVEGCQAGIQECMNRLRLFFCEVNKDIPAHEDSYRKGYQDCAEDVLALFEGWIDTRP